MINDVGFLAGRIWKYLSQHNEMDTIKIKLDLKISNTMLYLALGWLAREGKIYIKKEKKNYRVGLR